MSDSIIQLLDKKSASKLANEIKEMCVTAHENIQAAGRMLLDFKNREGWRALGYANWNECVTSEFRSTVGERRRVFELIQNAEVIENLAENGQKPHVSRSESTKTGALPRTCEELTIKHTAQLAKVPPELQSEALEMAIELGGGKATEKTIKKAVAGLKQAKEIHRDETGYAIPDTILPLWNRRQEVREVQNIIASAVRYLKTAHEQQPDTLWQAVNLQSIAAALQNAKRDLDGAMPYAVCCTCQGRAVGECTSCKGRGFISKHHYDVCVPEELKVIRSKSCVL